MNRQDIFEFVDQLEKFIQGVNRHQMTSSIGSAVDLNSYRAKLEQGIAKMFNVSLEEPPKTEELKCPDCGGPMKERYNRQNQNKFYGCARYPDCRGTRDENGLSKEERDAKRELIEYPQDQGYSFNKKRDVRNEGAS